jgi:hypothetical protein
LAAASWAGVARSAPQSDAGLDAAVDAAGMAEINAFLQDKYYPDSAIQDSFQDIAN